VVDVEVRLGFWAFSGNWFVFTFQLLLLQRLGELVPKGNQCLSESLGLERVLGVNLRHEDLDRQLVWPHATA
jgi:hypothetical protein